MKRVKMAETFDNEAEFDQKMTRLAELVKSARHCIVYTGAGISTAANIPDYRQPGFDFFLTKIFFWKFYFF